MTNYAFNGRLKNPAIFCFCILFNNAFVIQDLVPKVEDSTGLMKTLLQDLQFLRNSRYSFPNSQCALRVKSL
mgnify:CR=1 FL=1